MLSTEAIDLASNFDVLVPQVACLNVHDNRMGIVLKGTPGKMAQNRGFPSARQANNNDGGESTKELIGIQVVDIYTALRLCVPDVGAVTPWLALHLESVAKVWCIPMIVSGEAACPLPVQG